MRRIVNITFDNAQMAERQENYFQGLVDGAGDTVAQYYTIDSKTIKVITTSAHVVGAIMTKYPTRWSNGA
jgi:hypothetical protein